MRRFVVIFAAVANLVLLDAIAKESAAYYLKARAPVAVVQGFFDLAYVENRGCACGMLQGQVWPLAAFALVALAVVVWKRRAIFAPPGPLALTAEILMYSGIIGNFIDRAFRGFVVDMLDFHAGIHHFPCFNLADSFLTISVALLLISSFRAPAAATQEPQEKPK